MTSQKERMRRRLYFIFFALFCPLALEDDPEVHVCDMNATATCVFHETGRRTVKAPPFAHGLNVTMLI